MLCCSNIPTPSVNLSDIAIVREVRWRVEFVVAGFGAARGRRVFMEGLPGCDTALHRWYE